MPSTLPAPNEEQRAIVMAAQEGGSLAVNALAGTGKTTTLAMLAAAHPARSIHYLAFNKAIASEAQEKMPEKVTAQTFHSLAYRAMKPDRERLNQRLNGVYMAKRFRIKSMKVGGRTVSSAMIGGMVINALARYCASADRKIGKRHVPGLASVIKDIPAAVQQDEKGQKEVREVVRNLAVQAWTEQNLSDNDFPITHDTYVKQWALSNPRIVTDLILFDEAQDASPVFIDIVEQQDAPVVWVGDHNQQIYSWRGAVDALAEVKVDHELYLTKSYRFGPDIAATANIMLGALGEEKQLVGAGNGKPSRGDRAYLTRTNAQAIARFLKEKEQGNDDVQLVGANEMLSLTRHLEKLMDGKPGGPFALFNNYEELEEHAKSPEGRDLKVLVDAVDRYGIEELIGELEAAKNQHGSAGLTISTVHRAKGQEWDYVEVAGDWAGSKQDDPRPLADEEMRLMYVAITRARVELDHEKIDPWLELHGGESASDPDTNPEGNVEGEPEEDIPAPVETPAPALSSAPEPVEDDDPAAEDESEAAAPVRRRRRRRAGHGLTAEEVFAIADEIADAGGLVSANAVRKRLAAGSHETIQRHLVAWREQNPEKDTDTYQLPVELVNAVGREIQRKVDAVVIPLRDEMAGLQDELEDVKAERDALAREVEALRGRK